MDNLTIRIAEGKDLPDVLRLYAQPNMDKGQVLALSDAKIMSIFENEVLM